MSAPENPDIVSKAVREPLARAFALGIGDARQAEHLAAETTDALGVGF